MKTKNYAFFIYEDGEINKLEYTDDVDRLLFLYTRRMNSEYFKSEKDQILKSFYKQMENDGYIIHDDRNSKSIEYFINLKNINLVKEKIKELDDKEITYIDKEFYGYKMYYLEHLLKVI